MEIPIKTSKLNFNEAVRFIYSEIQMKEKAFYVRTEFGMIFVEV